MVDSTKNGSIVPGPPIIRRRVGSEFVDVVVLDVSVAGAVDAAGDDNDDDDTDDCFFCTLTQSFCSSLVRPLFELRPVARFVAPKRFNDWFGRV